MTLDIETRPARTQVASPEIDAKALKAVLTDGHEFALIDVREEVEYVKGHILYAVHVPRSRLELQIRALVPRFDTRVIVTDNGEGLADEVAGLLVGAGYSDVRLLAGRNAAWAAAGFTLYTGRNVPSIGFAEVVEEQLHTPNISAVELKVRLDRGDDILVLDTRPKEEFESFHIPGAINAAGVEILHRLSSLPIKPGTLLVANCAGRTRSILGAQTLVNAGVKNPIASLTGGTMEWLIAGYALDKGPGKTAAVPSPEKLEETRRLARQLADKAKVRHIDRATLADFKADADRTLYLFDVRLPDEYAAGHLPGFRSAQGGQLVSGTERFAAVRGARVVLYDNEGIRDLVSASWLVQLGGYEVFVLDDWAPEGEWEIGKENPRVLAGPSSPAPFVLPTTLADLLASGKVRLFDIASANAFRKGHIGGAVHATRGELAAAAAKGKDLFVVTSEDGAIAQYVVAELRQRHGADARVLLGGTAAWAAEKRPLEQGGLPEDAGEDVPDRYALRPARRDAEFRAYLDWEVSLVSLLGADPDAQAKFRIQSFQPAH